MAAAREMMQCEAGFSSVFRLSDPEETNLMLRLYNVDETPLWKLLDIRGFGIWSAVCFLDLQTAERAIPKMWLQISEGLLINIKQ